MLAAFFARGTAARLHALRAADGADPVAGSSPARAPSVTTRRAFSLSLTYVLGMALTYTAAGAAFAAAGQQVQAVFQQPWIIAAVRRAVRRDGAVDVRAVTRCRCPRCIQTRLAGTSNRQQAGTFGGVAVMGALSALIVTTCVGPALVAALSVIGQAGNVARGAVALFCDEPRHGHAAAGHRHLGRPAAAAGPAPGWTRSSSSSAR